MDYENILSRIRQFRDDRDWMQFHNPKNMAISIVLEATELMEHFQWKTPEESEAHVKENREDVEEEIADVAIYLFELCDNIGVNLEEAVLNKLKINDEKYPASKAKGSATKYTDL